MAATRPVNVFCKFTKRLRVPLNTKFFSRYISNLPISLSKRSLIRVSGEDKVTFLQGLCTADVMSPDMAQYAMFLNARGRVLKECILYKISEETWLIECCVQGREALLSHLTKYKLRSKVHIEPCKEYSVCWSRDSVDENLEGTFIAEDPRTSDLGHRILYPASTAPPPNSEGDYHQLRMRVGVAEGCEEVPTSECLPLEYNLDYMHGVSFTKGCYLGQELTARAHFTGVVRKRVVPITFEEPNTPLPQGTTVCTTSGRSVGRVIVKGGQLGLGLLKYGTNEQLFAVNPTCGDLLPISFSVPKWWRNED